MPRLRVIDKLFLLDNSRHASAIRMRMQFAAKSDMECSSACWLKLCEWAMGELRAWQDCFVQECRPWSRRVYPFCGKCDGKYGVRR